MSKGDKYINLYIFLSKQDTPEYILSFTEIENILGFTLPKSAYIYEAWWSNDTNHSQAFAWLNNNMRTKEIRLDLKKIIFEKHTDIIEKRLTKVYDKTNCFNTYYEIAIQSNLNKVDLNDCTFYQTPVTFVETDIQNVFLNYKGKTLNDLLEKKYYCGMRSIINLKYSNFLSKDISVFMQSLKENGDLFYFKFLNKNGADSFCIFKLIDKSIYDLKGLYAYFLDGKLKYIGRCRDSYNKRFNVNYGRINPINCYKEGQSTNTHINSLMNQYRKRISIYICPINDPDEIEIMEKKLISTFSPEWNRKK